MSLVSMLFLAVGFLPSLLALKVTFDNGGEAKYALSRPGFGDLNFLKGGQGFVRFALVVSSSPGLKFEKDAEVALKICFADKEAEIRNEQRAHDFIRKNGFIEGVVRAEVSLGQSLDEKGEIELALPKGKDKQDKYFILIMERLGTNLVEMYQLVRGFSPEQLDALYDQLCVILKQLKKIGLVHGDVKPLNILFKRSDEIEDGIKLVDLGFAVFKGSDTPKCAGDDMYRNPSQEILERLANYNDVDGSGAYSIAQIGIGNLPWLVFINDLEQKAKKRRYDLHDKRILVAKHEFNLNPFSTFSDNGHISSALKKKISDTIKDATRHEIASIQKKIDVFKNAIQSSIKNGLI